MESRVSLVFAPKADREKHHTNHTIDNGVVAVHEAAPFVAAFSVTLRGAASTTHRCTALQK